MKIKTKFRMLNIILWVALAAFSFWAIFYLVDSLHTEPYVIKTEHLDTIESAFNDMEEELVGVSDANIAKTVASKYNQETLERGFKLICYDYNKNTVYKGTVTDKDATRLAAETRSSPVWVFYDGEIIYTAKYGNYYMLAVNSANRVANNIFKAYLWYPLGIVGLTAVALFIISLVEYYSIFPRLKRLNYAMHQVYFGNYSKVIDSKKTYKDEICELIIEFEMMRKHLSDLARAKAEFDRQRGETITGITHDLKTPLTVIQGYAKGLVDGVAARTGKTNEYAQKIYEMVKSMNVLVNKLADFSKPGNDEIIYTFVERDIVEIVKDFVSKYSIQYAAKGLNIKAEYKVHKIVASIDREQFVRILQNILDNSVKYKVKPEGNSMITLFEEDNKAVIIIADDGEGIEEYETEYIFESYYRGDPSRTNPISGSGLGLSIVKNIVAAHKGEVTAYNDNGLAIKISIPQRRNRK